jgi:hypothetical protein
MILVERRIKMNTSTFTQQENQDRLDRTQTERMDQYSLWQILGILALVALPMALLSWVVAPAIIPYSPLHPGITFWLLIIAGMVWQFLQKCKGFLESMIGWQTQFSSVFITCI